MPQDRNVEGYATQEDLNNAWHSLGGCNNEGDRSLPTRPQLRAIVTQYPTFAARAKLPSEDFFKGRPLRRLLHVLGRNESYSSTEEEDPPPVAVPYADNESFNEDWHKFFGYDATRGDKLPTKEQMQKVVQENPAFAARAKVCYHHHYHNYHGATVATATTTTTTYHLPTANTPLTLVCTPIRIGG